MVYQLAKTSPLLSGQVKMNMILNGNRVVDLQYTPISNYIPFAYNNPSDVLNYTHAENIKMLYNKIPNSFFSDVCNPTLNTKQLHRYNVLADDTHEASYEMGMKRLEYKRYNKQFEFFCPFWCDNVEDFKKLRFVINLKNIKDNVEEERVLYSKELVFDEKIKDYFLNLHSRIEITESKNEDLVFISFNNMESHIKGINVKSGVVQTVDTSYAVNNLLYQERPVLEVDNMILDLFAANNIISTQLFNFSFAFDLSDFMPINLVNNFISERINVYIDMYLEDENGEKTKVQEKDFYTNYEFIPRYNVCTGKYDETENVFDYLNDNVSVDLINKNKLIQSTFHWVLKNNKSSIFNLYNGFSPIVKNDVLYKSGTSISNSETNLFTDVFDITKNPLGVFKFTNFKITENAETNNIGLMELLNDDSIYSTVTINKDSLAKQEYQFFENLLIDNKKLMESKSLKDNFDGIDELKVATVLIPSSFNYAKLASLFSGSYSISQIDEYDGSLMVAKTLSDELPTQKLIFILIFNDWTAIPATIKNNLYFYPLYNKQQFEAKDNVNITNCLNLLLDVIKSTSFYNYIVFDKSFASKRAISPSILSEETQLLKADKNVELYRYDSNIIPMFIDLQGSIHKNNVYWCKQYDRNIQNEINKGNAEIINFSKYALTKFTPVFKSLGYYVLNDMVVDYTKFYNDSYKKERTWFKNNSFIYLPTHFVEHDYIIDTNTQLSEDNIIDIILNKVTNESECIGKQYDNEIVKYYIKDLYEYTYTYDYVSDENIDKQKYDIKFTLK